MAKRRVLADINHSELRFVTTESSMVALEPFNLEFETIEDAFEYVVIHPERFSGELYATLLERLRELGGDGF